MELKHKTILFLGDSITEGCAASSPDKIYHQLIKEKYGLRAAVNYGIGGTRIARQQTKSDPAIYDEDFCKRFPMMQSDADAIVVFGGTNDYGHGDAPIGTFNDRTVNTFYGACHVLMEGLMNKYIGKPIIFMTPLHRLLENSKIINGKETDITLKDYVDAIKEVAQYYSLPVLDLYSESGLQPNVKSNCEYYFSDGLHPNDNGHAHIAEVLGMYLESKM